MARTLPSAPGSDPILAREAEILNELIDAKIAAKNPVALARVYIGCDGLQHVQIPNGVSCCDTCETAPGSLVPVYTGGGSGNSGPITGSTPYVHAGTAGMPTISGGSRSLPAPSAPAAARYLDTRGNLWDENGLFISTGNTPAAISNEYQFIDEYWPEDPPDSPPAGGSIKQVAGGATRALLVGASSGNGSGSDDTYHTPAFDGALNGTAIDGGLLDSGEVLCSVEFKCSTTPGVGRIAGPWIVIRAQSGLAPLANVALSSPASGFDWSVGRSPDGTWIVHRVVSVSGAGSRTLHRIGWVAESLVDFGPVLTITNTGTGGPVAWVVGDFIKQVQ